MNRFKIFASFAFSVVLLSSVSNAQGIDPVYGFPFGYSLGYQNSFRNRLPAPPYFSIFPPVYYGKRHVRPYGESPYASFPLLGTSPEYSPVPANATIGVSRVISNPHAPGCCADNSKDETDTELPAVNAVAERMPGSPRIIVNPYAQEQVAKNE